MKNWWQSFLGKIVNFVCGGAEHTAYWGYLLSLALEHSVVVQLYALLCKGAPLWTEVVPHPPLSSRMNARC